MKPFWIVMIVILVIAVIALIALYFFGKKLQKRQEEQQVMMQQMAQSVSLMVVDKKKMRLKDVNGLPKQVLEQTPKYLRRTKMPVVRAKVGPKIMTLLCDEKVFEILPLRTEVKAVVSGLYITGVKSIRGKLVQPEPKQKGIKGFVARFRKSNTK
ncbi:hypothetical protein P261_01862 [Lachnospiraceae bacterium TWA4]|nr:hypothetical protein P261_01862 [Lachnospiraceae bacterium TWA4]